ncbi:Protein of unknown function [Pyronema omphalodes CBS 100304]|uniref:Uncharacterized protein n=1 Tax=Pyronema omphalodes (strain CBS 100304) TaxID=1076935 RepID=U4L0A4_PYROM|nr:Protein of unknown function [Pyronema omphalodes CBS 100304]
MYNLLTLTQVVVLPSFFIESMTGRVSSRLLFLHQLDVGYPSIHSRSAWVSGAINPIG